jgi:hypothetical protein
VTTYRALAAEGRTAHAEAEASTPLPWAQGIEIEAFRSWHWKKALQVNWTFNLAVGLTFDVRGWPQASPLDGGVMRHRRQARGFHDELRPRQSKWYRL